MTASWIWRAALKDLKRYAADWTALLLWMGIPLLIGGLITVVMGGRGGPTPKAHLLVADLDGGNLSAFLVQGLSQGPLADLITTEKTDQESGLRRMDQGEATGLLIIPKGFGDAFREDRPTQLRLVTNPSQTILPQIVESALRLFVDAGFYAQRIFGPELRRIHSDPAGSVSGIGLTIGSKMQAFGKYLFPPVIQVEQVMEGEKQESPSLAVLFLPGIALMGLLFAAQGLSEDLWKEKSQATLARASSSPAGVPALMIGKLLASLAVIAVISLVLLVMGMAYAGLPWVRFPLAWLWSIGAGGLFYALLLGLQTWVSSQRGGSILTSAVVFPLLMIGGSFFPTEAMPVWMAAVGRWTPNGWALERLKNILLDRPDAVSPWIALLVLPALTALVFGLAARRARRVFVQT